MTPTSATGVSSPAAERGLTLVEVMVAVLVMALLASAVLITTPDSGPRLADEAERLAARLAHARDAAVTANRPVEMALDAEGYAFREQRRGRWTPLEDGPFQPQRWPEGLAVSVEAGEGRSAVRFDSTGAAEPVTVRLTNRIDTVALTVDAQGEVRIDDRAR